MRWANAVTFMVCVLVLLLAGCLRQNLLSPTVSQESNNDSPQTTQLPTVPEEPPVTSAPLRFVFETANPDGTFSRISTLELTINTRSTVRLSVFDTNSGVELSSNEVGQILTEVRDTSIAIWIETSGRFISFSGVAAGETLARVQASGVGVELPIRVIP